jgi:uncharacterized protein (TIGR02099 family)
MAAKKLNTLAKLALASAAVVVVLLALAIGGFRVLATELPRHQADLQAWVNERLGLRLQFARVDAHWGWRGPELTFRQASVAAAGDSEPFLTARGASVGFKPIALLVRLITRQEPGIDRLTVEGTDLTLVQTADNEFRLQGAPESAAPRPEVPPDVEVLVRDSRVRYVDERRKLTWDFENVEASMRRDAGTLLLSASAEPPSEFGRRIELTAQASLEKNGDPKARSAVAFGGDWRVYADVEGMDLAVAAQLLPPSVVAPQAGNGDVAVWLDWQQRELTHGTIKLALEDVALPMVSGTAGSRFDRIAFNAEWQRNSDGWRAALNDVAVTRNGVAWPANVNAVIELGRDSSGRVERLALQSDFLRLQDLTPFLWPMPDSAALETWFALAPRGDLREANVEVKRAAESYDYNVTAQFEGLGIARYERFPGFDSLTGELRADTRSGRIELKSHGVSFDWPTVFGAKLPINNLDGLVVWREGQNAIRVVSDNLAIGTPDASTQSSMELTLPRDGSSPRLDLETTVSDFDASVVPRYLPVHTMPDTVVEWLNDALRGGRVHDTHVTFFGPLKAFPFDGGEGQFRVSAAIDHATLRYVHDWPEAEDLDGTVEFVNAGFAAHGSGRVLGNHSSDVEVAIPDMRHGLLSVKASTIGPLSQVLSYLQSSPLIASSLGPNFARLESPNGTGEVSFDLNLPLLDRAAYRLTASLGIVDGELAFRGFDPHATEIQGTLQLHDGELTGDDIEAIFLDGPVTARVSPATEDGYRTRLDLDGEVTVDAVAKAFDLPFAEQLAGQTAWRGALLIPTPDTGAGVPPKITIGSNLSGVALRFPAPFAKAPGEPVNLQVNLLFPENALEMDGYLGASRRFALQFDATPEAEAAAARGAPQDAGAAAPDAQPAPATSASADPQAPAARQKSFVFRRGALRFGGALPELHAEHGVTVDGTLPLLDMDEWLAIGRGSGDAAGAGWGEAFAGADLTIADFRAFGQQLSSSKLTVRRLTDDWQIEVDSDAIAGTLLVPANLRSDPSIVAVMRRLYLNAGDGTSPSRKIDPRRLPGLQLHADEFAIGARRLGRLDAEILPDPLGLRLVSFESSSPGMTAQGSGSWFTGADGDTTRFAVSMTSANVAGALQQLGFDPVIEAKSAEVTASVYWPGAPTDDWMQHVSGDFAVKTDTGSLVDVDPGAGRMIGLMSITALPRRLALDFRDVFNRGLVFDEITADFVVIDGNAYTNNLKLTGPVAEIGMVGRVGLRDRDYRQQAVVTAEPGKVLPTVGGLLGGPAVAAALLIFTQIFKKPLKGIGRASYCVTGSWQEPTVERLSSDQAERGQLCAELPPNGLSRPQEVAVR